MYGMKYENCVAVVVVVMLKIHSHVDVGRAVEATF
jgi:hypothetical protein